MSESDFALSALIFLAAAVVAVPVFTRLGLGAVIGYLIAGIAIGPWGLQLIGEVEQVMQVSELGVVLLLFLVGLELNPRRLWQMRTAIFGIGTLQLLLTIAAIGLMAHHLLHQKWTVALVAGMAGAMSSTAIALASLQERHLLQTQAGQSSFAVSLFQDLSVIPLMIILSLLAPGEAHDEAAFDLAKTVKALAAIVVAVAIGRLLLRPLLRWIARTGLREIFIATALLLVIGFATLMDWVGLSMAMGSFLAGLLLADSEYRLELELDIEPFKGLLLGLFFMAVGMSIDIGLILKEPLLILALAALVVLIKVVILAALGWGFRMSRADVLIFAFAISQVGEFAFVLTAVAHAERVINTRQLALMNAVVAASMMATPLLLTAYTRLIAPRMTGKARDADRIDEQNAVIIGGFGRFGQVLMRLLRAKGYKATIIDQDPNQIELVRSFGWRAYYGDISRPDVLKAAGADKARLMIIAIDDAAVTLRTVAYIKRAYPELQLLVRAHGRTDAFELMAQDVPVVRETFGSAVDAAEQALRLLGASAFAARRAAHDFRQHDEQLLAEQLPHRHDRAELLNINERARRDLEDLLSEEIREQTEAAGQARDLHRQA